MTQRVPMTPRGYARLQEDLRRLKSQDRPGIVREIERARAHGDLAENAEYHAAKERQGQIEGRILQVEDKLARAQVIESSGEPPEGVRFGVTVVLIDVHSDEEVTYTLVGEDESDLAKGLISVNSPVARALISKRVDDEVTVRVPRGTRELQIREIRFD